MRTIICCLFIGLTLGCGPSSVDSDNALSVAGSYQLTEYSVSGKLDDNPTGEVTVKRVDNQHVSIIVKGTSGKTKLAYSFPSVTVFNLEKDYYSLLVKGKSLGEAGTDGISHYVTLRPSATIVIKSTEF